MAKVTSIGGVFFKCNDTARMREWYARHLGINMESWGAQMNWSDEPHKSPYTVFSFFKNDSDYFKPSSSPFMINFRVDDLDALVAQLRSEGVELAGEPVDGEYGKFAWVIDPEGNKVELWEQTA